MKYGRRGSPKEKFVYLSSSEDKICWCDSKTKSNHREIMIEDVHFSWFLLIFCPNILKSILHTLPSFNQPLLILLDLRDHNRMWHDGSNEKEQSASPIEQLMLLIEYDRRRSRGREAQLRLKSIRRRSAKSMDSILLFETAWRKIIRVRSEESSFQHASIQGGDVTAVEELDLRLVRSVLELRDKLAFALG